MVLTALAWSSLRHPFALAFWIAVAFPVTHQVFVWLAWRLELRSSAISASIGFKSYLLIFLLLFAGRIISLLILARIDRGSLGLPLPSRSCRMTVFHLKPVEASSKRKLQESR